jgi:hypothetical protein
MLRCFGAPDARPTADELVRALIVAEFMPEISRAARAPIFSTLNGGTVLLSSSSSSFFCFSFSYKMFRF